MAAHDDVDAHREALLQLGQPLAVAVEDAARRRSRDGTSGCSASALTARSREPVSAASIVVRSTSLIVSISARACSGTSPDRGRDAVRRGRRRTGTSTTARSSRNGSARAVGGVEDQHRAALFAIASTTRHRLALVAAGVAAPVVLARRCPRRRAPRPCSCARARGASRARPPAPPRATGRRPRRRRPAARAGTRRAAAAPADRADGVGAVVEVVQVLVRDHPERAQPLARRTDAPPRRSRAPRRRRAAPGSRSRRPSRAACSQPRWLRPK